MALLMGIALTGFCIVWIFQSKTRREIFVEFHKYPIFMIFVAIFVFCVLGFLWGIIFGFNPIIKTPFGSFGFLTICGFGGLICLLVSDLVEKKFGPRKK